MQLSSLRLCCHLLHRVARFDPLAKHTHIIRRAARSDRAISTTAAATSGRSRARTVTGRTGTRQSQPGPSTAERQATDPKQATVQIDLELQSISADDLSRYRFASACFTHVNAAPWHGLSTLTITPGVQHSQAAQASILHYCTVLYCTERPWLCACRHRGLDQGVLQLSAEQAVQAGLLQEIVSFGKRPHSGTTLTAAYGGV